MCVCVSQFLCVLIKVRQRKVESTPLLSPPRSLSEVVKSYRDVISESLQGLTHAPRPDPESTFDLTVNY